MISSLLGHSLDKPFAPLVRKININPNIFTVFGFAVTAAAGAAISQNLRLGGALILAGGFLDMLDGIAARTNGRVTDFGAFLDSVLDRYSDAFLFLGAAWYLREDLTGVVLSTGTLVGAFLISYSRARAEGLGKECKSGLMERPERILLLALGALTGWLLPVLWAMFFLTHITVIQRLYHVWSLMSKGGGSGQA
ncbi:MAG: CDP-alcohol phosphatidyltransferase family protein [Thermodesulfovibrionales bacterium]|nr:CDP-alcohol phosphatidyltransferase family protein [Thermodesulfovibrionales bacterium]